MVVVYCLFTILLHLVCLYFFFFLFEDFCIFESSLRVRTKFHSLALMNNATMNIQVQVFAWTYVFISLGYIPRIWNPSWSVADIPLHFFYIFIFPIMAAFILLMWSHSNVLILDSLHTPQPTSVNLSNGF